MSLNIPALVAEVAGFVAKIPPDVIPHVRDFVRALWEGDEDKAKRAATSALTARMFKAPVRRPPPKPPKLPER